MNEALLIYMIEINQDIPSIKACITLNGDRTLTITIEKKIIPLSHFKDLTDGTVRRMSQLINLMARVKS